MVQCPHQIDLVARIADGEQGDDPDIIGEVLEFLDVRLVEATYPAGAESLPSGDKYHVLGGYSCVNGVLLGGRLLVIVYQD